MGGTMSSGLGFDPYGLAPLAKDAGAKLKSARAVDGTRCLVTASIGISTLPASAFVLSTLRGHPATITGVSPGPSSETLYIDTTPTTLGGLYQITPTSGAGLASGAVTYIGSSSDPEIGVSVTNDGWVNISGPIDVAVENVAIRSDYPVIPLIEDTLEIPGAGIQLGTRLMTSASYTGVIGVSHGFGWGPDEEIPGTASGVGKATPSPLGAILTGGQGYTRTLPTVASENVRGRFSVRLDTASLLDYPTPKDYLTLGSEELGVTLMVGSDGVQKLRTPSGLLIARDWRDGQHTIEITRNTRMGLMTLVWDGEPVASLDSESPLSNWQIKVESQLQGVILTGSVRGSNTVFDSYWNLVLDVEVPFVGVPMDVTTEVYATEVPLVKNLTANPTLANAEDVILLVNGEEVGVASVNPYTGKIVPTIPIPNGAEVTVDARFHWWSQPLIPLALNYEGALTNTYEGMEIVLGPEVPQPTPHRYSYRWLGFDQDTPVLNDEDSFVLNQDPLGWMIAPLTHLGSRVVVSYTGGQPDWDLVGSDDGGPDGAAYTLIGGPAHFAKLLPKTPGTRLMAVRTISVSGASGEWTGVGFGFHDGHHQHAVGFCTLQGIKTIGLLGDAGWTHGPTLTVTRAGDRVLTGTLPVDTRLVLDGLVYTVVESLGGFLTLDRDLPMGFESGVAVTEVDWSQPVSLRLVPGEVLVDGRYSGSFTGDPASSLLWGSVLDPSEGQCFWGSFEIGASQSTWGFVRCSYVPSTLKTLGWHSVSSQDWVSKGPLVQGPLYFDGFVQGREQGMVQMCPLLTQDAEWTVQGTLQGDGDLRVDDGDHRYLLRCLYYQDAVLPKSLVTLSGASYWDALSPESQGWVALPGGALRTSLAARAMPLEAALDVTLAEGDVFQMSRLDPGMTLQVSYTLGSLEFKSISGGVLFDMSLNPGRHNVRVVLNTLCMVYVDNVNVGFFLPEGLLDPGVSENALTFTPGLVHAVRFREVPGAGVKRTLGLWSGGPLDQLDSWQVPRVDSARVSPSSALSSIQPFDWMSPLAIELHRVQDFGVYLALPGRPLPPYAQEGNALSQGWAFLENGETPLVRALVGEVYYGVTGLGLVKWVPPTFDVSAVQLEGSYRSARLMVLNRGSVVSSGEMLRERAAEVALVRASGSSLMFRSVDIDVADVFQVVDGGSILYRDSWTWDVSQQTLTLKTGSFVSPVVTVSFRPGPRVTETYLRRQPWFEGNEILVEGASPEWRANSFRVESEELRVAAVSTMHEHPLRIQTIFDV